MLLSSRLGQHVGEAATDTDTAVVGEGAAQGRATTRTSDCTGLTDRLADGTANARTEASRRPRNGNTAPHRGIDALARRGPRYIAQRSSAGDRGHITKIESPADEE